MKSVSVSLGDAVSRLFCRLVDSVSLVDSVRLFFLSVLLILSASVSVVD